jgi:hypothetical protein
MSDAQPAPRHFPVTAAVFEGGLALAALVLGAILGVDPMRTLRSDWPAIGFGALAALPPLLLLAAAARCPWGAMRRLMELVENTLVPPLRQCNLVELAIIALLAGLGEELLFRGLIQAGVEQWIDGEPGPWIALAAASILFGVAHFITLSYAVFALLMGIYLGGLWMWSGNLLVPIVAHAVYDFLALAYLVKLRPPGNDHDPT